MIFILISIDDLIPREYKELMNLKWFDTIEIMKCYINLLGANIRKQSN